METWFDSLVREPIIGLHVQLKACFVEWMRASNGKDGEYYRLTVGRPMGQLTLDDVCSKGHDLVISLGNSFGEWISQDRMHQALELLGMAYGEDRSQEILRALGVPECELRSKWRDGKWIQGRITYWHTRKSIEVVNGNRSRVSQFFWSPEEERRRERARRDAAMAAGDFAVGMGSRYPRA